MGIQSRALDFIRALQRFQNRYLGIVVNAPWYVTNDTRMRQNEANNERKFVQEIFTIQRDVLISNLERPENFSNRSRSIFRPQTELKKAYIFKRKQFGIQLYCRQQIATADQKPALVQDNLVAFNCRARSPTQTWKYYKDFRIESLTHLGTSMTLYITISTCHTLETRLKDSARDTPIGWRNISTYSRLNL